MLKKEPDEEKISYKFHVRRDLIPQLLEDEVTEVIDYDFVRERVEIEFQNEEEYNGFRIWLDHESPAEE